MPGCFLAHSSAAGLWALVIYFNYKKLVKSPLVEGKTTSMKKLPPLYCHGILVQLKINLQVMPKLPFNVQRVGLQHNFAYM